MDYVTAYDVGDRKRDSGINEDSVAVCVFQDGHRDGLVQAHETSGDSTAAADATPSDRDTTRPADRSTAAKAGRTDSSTDLFDVPDDGGPDTDESGDGRTDLESLLAADEDGDPAASSDAAGEAAADELWSDLGGDGAETSDAGASSGEEARAHAGQTPIDDSSPESRHVAVFALADGAGGYDAGDVASYIASTVVVEELAPLAVRAARSDPAAFGIDIAEPVPETPSAATFQRAIADAVQTAHRRILAYADAAGQPAFTTVVAGIAVDGELHYGWVGDSRAYVLAEELETTEQLTRDHSVVENLLDAGAIDEVEAHVHPRGNEITSALGGHPGAEIETAMVGVETHTVPLWRDDVVLVTSDGLIDAQTDAPVLHEQYLDADGSDESAARIRDAVVTDDELRDGVVQANSLQAAAGDLVDLANDRGGKDNISLLLFRDPSLPAAPPAERRPTRAMDPDEAVEDRQTVILPDE